MFKTDTIQPSLVEDKNNLGLHPVAEMVLQTKMSGCKSNGIIEFYVTGPLFDWRLGQGGETPESYINMRTTQLEESLLTVGKELVGKSLQEQLGTLEDLKVMEMSFINEMMSARNHTKDGSPITEAGIRSKTDSKLSQGAEIAGRVSEGLIGLGFQNPHRETIFGLAMKHFEQITGEKIIRSEAKK